MITPDNSKRFKKAQKMFDEMLLLSTARHRIVEIEEGTRAKMKLG